MLSTSSDAEQVSCTQRALNCGTGMRKCRPQGKRPGTAYIEKVQSCPTSRGRRESSKWTEKQLRTGTANVFKHTFKIQAMLRVHQIQMSGLRTKQD